MSGEGLLGIRLPPFFVRSFGDAGGTGDHSRLTCGKELLDTYLDLPSVDRDRVYVVGLSMGGMATYDLAIRFPDTFAAAVPICGTVNPGRLADAVSVRFHIFHGDADNVVPIEGSREAYKALKKLGAEVEYVEFPGCNPAFNYPGFMEWLFACRKK